MCKTSDNIYRNARKTAGVTQERAAEMLGLSPRSIQDYEAGDRVPSHGTVELMAIAFRAPWLVEMHALSVSKGALDIIPTYDPAVGLSQATCDLVSKIYAFADEHKDRRLLSIAADNKIDGNEREEFDAIMVELQDLVRTALSLRYAKETEGTK
ncbi:MAG: helix-turn-helix transcriptional regulator [Oscillospiraceae bacterium]